MNILQKITAHKRIEVEAQKTAIPAHTLSYSHEVISFSKALQQSQSPGIIAEIKRSAPSSGSLNETIDVANLAQGYQRAGAAALSILTDQQFFKGSIDDIKRARQAVSLPILRKDFIIDEYQILEARSIGADCILLIAAILTPDECFQLASCAKILGLEVLLEVHNTLEITSHLNIHIDIIGVNNRNLEDFTISISNSLNLAPAIPDSMLKISESGITTAKEMLTLSKHGFSGFLIGSHFMRQPKPDKACADLIDEFVQGCHPERSRGEESSASARIKIKNQV